MKSNETAKDLREKVEIFIEAVKMIFVVFMTGINTGGEKIVKIIKCACLK